MTYMPQCCLSITYIRAWHSRLDIITLTILHRLRECLLQRALNICLPVITPCSRRVEVAICCSVLRFGSGATCGCFSGTRGAARCIARYVPPAVLV